MVSSRGREGAGHNRGGGLRGQTTMHKINKLQGCITHRGCNQYFIVAINGVWSFKSVNHCVAHCM